MNLLHLEYFYTVAKEGGYLKASKKLRIQQPAISRMVAHLEDYMGFKLFEKIGRNVRMTKQGEEIFESCIKIFDEVHHLKISLGKISGQKKGPLVIAASEPLASHFLPSRLTKLVHQYPDIYPNLYSGPAYTMLNLIESGEIELGLFFHLPLLSEKLILEKTLEIQFRLVVRTEDRRNETVLTHFIGSREIDDASTKSFPTLEKLKKKYPKAKIKTSSNNLTAHKELVMNGLGVSVLPEFLIKNELKNKLLVDLLPDENMMFKLKVVRRKNSILSTNAQALLELI